MSEKTPPIKVALCIPWGNQVDAMFAWSLARLYGRIVGEFVVPGYADVAMFTVNGSYLPQSRRELVQAALEWEATHLLWLDSDMVFPDHVFRSLLKHDKPMVGCNYARRRPPYSPTAIKTIGEAEALCYTTDTSTGLEEVDAVGFGVLLMQASILPSISPKAFEIVLDDQGHLRIGEDVNFCKLAKEAGFGVFVDHDLSKEIGHMGSFQYKNAYSTMLRDESKPHLIVVPGQEH